MLLENHENLSPYWQRLMAEAEEILERRISDLEKQTCDPEYCLLDRDKRMMERRQMDIEGHKNVLETIRNNSFGAKFWAFDTVWGEYPRHVFKPAG